MLAGVARNKALVVFPGYVHLLLWMDRLLPGLVFLGNLKAVRDFRKLRKDGYREEHRKPV